MAGTVPDRIKINSDILWAQRIPKYKFSFPWISHKQPPLIGWGTGLANGRLPGAERWVEWGLVLSIWKIQNWKIKWLSKLASMSHKACWSKMQFLKHWGMTKGIYGDAGESERLKPGPGCPIGRQQCPDRCCLGKHNVSLNIQLWLHKHIF